MARKKIKIEKEIKDSFKKIGVENTNIEDLTMDIQFTKDHIEDVKKGEDIICFGNGVNLSKKMYLEGAYLVLKKQEEFLNKLNTKVYKPKKHK
jgi:hypothetical protein